MGSEVTYAFTVVVALLLTFVHLLGELILAGWKLRGWKLPLGCHPKEGGNVKVLEERIVILTSSTHIPSVIEPFSLLFLLSVHPSSFLPSSFDHWTEQVPFAQLTTQHPPKFHTAQYG